MESNDGIPWEVERTPLEQTHQTKSPKVVALLQADLRYPTQMASDQFDIAEPYHQLVAEIEHPITPLCETDME
jgi:hypothetical protein